MYWFGSGTRGSECCRLLSFTSEFSIVPERSTVTHASDSVYRSGLELRFLLWQFIFLRVIMVIDQVTFYMRKWSIDHALRIRILQDFANAEIKDARRYSKELAVFYNRRRFEPRHVTPSQRTFCQSPLRFTCCEIRSTVFSGLLETNDAHYIQYTLSCRYMQ